MNQPPIIRAARATISLLVVTAWLLAANHCVVAGLLPKQTAASGHEHCPAPETPAKETEPAGCDGSSCCKSLAAPTVAIAKPTVDYDALSFIVKEYFIGQSIDSGEPRIAFIAEVDTGPPGSMSFAESVLQRSILAHAPPSLV